MADHGYQWSLSNPGPQSLSVWLEPWADEVAVPVRSTIGLTVAAYAQDCSLDEVAWTPDQLGMSPQEDTAERIIAMRPLPVRDR
jgi:hypothetical protein